MSETKKYLKPKELAERLGLSLSTLAHWRCDKEFTKENPKGPRWKKIGNSIRYPIEEVMAYEEKGNE